MTSLIEYSAINTKIKAMQSRLLNLNDYKNLAESANVAEAVSKLQYYKNYSVFFKDFPNDKLHRSYIEKLLIKSKFNDFGKLYKFADLKQKRFLNLYFMSYETELLKRCLRNCLSYRPLDIDLSEHKTFFNRHSKVDFESLIKADSINSFLDSISKSIYYSPLEAVYKSSHSSIFNYELCIDILYFKTVWKSKDKMYSKMNVKILEKFFGTKLDLLNIQWIYRSKKYYNISEAQLYSMLIPIYYKLDETALKKLISATDINDFLKIFETTYYGMMSKKILYEKADIESFSAEIMRAVNLDSVRKNPYSVALLNSYLFEKEEEISRIISVIEAVRFGYNADRIMSEILNINKNNNGRRSTA